MPRGRKTSCTIRLTPAQHHTLLAWQRVPTVPTGLARRARIIVLLADGMTITDIAAAVGVSRMFVYKWIQRFGQDGLEGLHDKPATRPSPRPLPPTLGEPSDMEVG